MVGFFTYNTKPITTTQATAINIVLSIYELTLFLSRMQRGGFHDFTFTRFVNTIVTFAR